MASKTHGLTLLLDHSESIMAERNAQGKAVLSPRRQVEFAELRRKLAVFLGRAEADLVNVIGFGVNSQNELAAAWPTMMPAKPENRSYAGQFLQKLEIGDGTPTLETLQLALADADCTRIILITDGLPSGGQSAVLDWLVEARRVRQFELYTIGIGNLGFGEAIGDKVDWPVREFLQTVAIENAGGYVDWKVDPAGAQP